jgi:hypothetical protein
MNQQFGAEITRGLVGTLTAGRAVTASSSLAKCERVRGGLPMAFPFCPHWLDAEPQSSNHALSGRFALKRDLIDKENGISDGVCELLPDFLDVPTNRYPPFADFCREAVMAGFLKSVPVQLR